MSLLAAALALLSGCFAPSQTTFRTRPPEPAAVVLKTPLTLPARITSITISVDGDSRAVPPEFVQYLVDSCRSLQLFSSVNGPTGRRDDTTGVELRFDFREHYERDSVGNLVTMLLWLPTLGLSSMVMPVTAHMDQTATLVASLPGEASTTYTATSQTTRTMAMAGPSEDFLHYIGVTSVNVKSLQAQLRNHPSLSRWERDRGGERPNEAAGAGPDDQVDR